MVVKLYFVKIELNYQFGNLKFVNFLSCLPIIIAVYKNFEIIFSNISKKHEKYKKQQKSKNVKKKVPKYKYIHISCNIVIVFKLKKIMQFCIHGGNIVTPFNRKKNLAHLFLHHATILYTQEDIYESQIL